MIIKCNFSLICRNGRPLKVIIYILKLIFCDEISIKSKPPGVASGTAMWRHWWTSLYQDCMVHCQTWLLGFDHRIPSTNGLGHVLHALWRYSFKCGKIMVYVLTYAVTKSLVFTYISIFTIIWIIANILPIR